MNEDETPADRDLDQDQVGSQGRRRPQRRSMFGCLAVLVALAVVVGGFYFVVDRGVDLVRNKFSAPQDYPGPGQGKVLYEVEEGDSAGAIGRGLKEAGVVKSVDAFTAAAAAEPGSLGIQVGFYELRRKMKAADALEVMIDNENLLRTAVTVPEGLRLVDIVDLLAKNTKFSKAGFQAALDKPGSIGLPDYAQGNAEGYLFPATYAYPPNATPTSMLSAMVDRWRLAADEAGLEDAAGKLGYTPAELMIVASLVEAEANREEDRGKVARVIYNRLEGDETNGLLQIDASVNYGLQQDLGVALTTEQLQQDTPYNTYTRPGLPPTPIEAPGDAAVAAAAHPTEGDWYYYVTVDLKTGETKFAETYEEFLGYKQEFKTYCETSDAC